MLCYISCNKFCGMPSNTCDLSHLSAIKKRATRSLRPHYATKTSILSNPAPTHLAPCCARLPGASNRQTSPASSYNQPCNTTGLCT